MAAFVIPALGPIEEVELDGRLDQLQAIVGGWVQALPVPEFIDPDGRTTLYINEEGKYEADCEPNMRATDFMVPGIGIFMGDYIAGPMIVCGFNPTTGENTDTVPEPVAARVRLIERESGL